MNDSSLKGDACIERHLEINLNPDLKKSIAKYAEKNHRFRMTASGSI